MQTLEQLKRYTDSNTDLDDAVELHARATALKASYVGLGLAVPEELTEGLQGLERDIKAKRREQLEHQLKLAKTRRAGLATAEEKRQAEEARIKELEAELAK